MSAAAVPGAQIAPELQGPFDLGSGPHAVLCLHGLTARPYEVRPIAEALVARGLRCVGPRLAGHESPEALARVRYDEWLADARDALAALRAEHEHVLLAGVSLGGLVSLALAAEEPVAGVAVVGVPLRLRFPIPQLVPLAKHLKPFLRKKGSDIRDPAARARHPSFDVMPLPAVHELVKLQAHVRGQLARVHVPILVAHGVHDATANPADAEEIERSVGSLRRELLLLGDSAHIATVDHDGARLSEAVAVFFSGIFGD